ncbi:MAG: hypothetical protein WA705_20545 [Candidatus Ozemobacteraceae bacterium]
MNAEQALEELGAPVKSFRIMALEWAIHEGNGPAMAFLQNRKKSGYPQREKANSYLVFDFLCQFSW